MSEQQQKNKYWLKHYDNKMMLNEIYTNVWTFTQILSYIYILKQTYLQTLLDNHIFSTNVQKKKKEKIDVFQQITVTGDNDSSIIIIIIVVIIVVVAFLC